MTLFFIIFTDPLAEIQTFYRPKISIKVFKYKSTSKTKTKKLYFLWVRVTLFYQDYLFVLY